MRGPPERHETRGQREGRVDPARAIVTLPAERHEAREGRALVARQVLDATKVDECSPADLRDPYVAAPASRRPHGVVAAEVDAVEAPLLTSRALQRSPARAAS